MVDTKMYRNYVTYDRKGDAMLHVEMNKALYGLFQSALVFYKKLRKDLEAYVFVINTYYQCVSNTTVDGHQMTAMACGRPQGISQGTIPYHQFRYLPIKNLWR